MGHAGLEGGTSVAARAGRVWQITALVVGGSNVEKPRYDQFPDCG